MPCADNHVEAEGGTKLAEMLRRSTGLTSFNLGGTEKEGRT